MLYLLESLLSKQDPEQPHSILTRLVVSFCIGFAIIVLYGFYGLCAGIVTYLLGVELLGLPQKWAFYPVVLGFLSGAWMSVRHLRDYWRNFGNGDS